MPTDLQPAYAEIDEELFDVDQIPLTSRDVRSVGEMLFDVDYLARQLLMDVDGDAAGTLLRSWPTMVAAAEDLWASLPGRRPGVDERDRPCAEARDVAAIHLADVRAKIADLKRMERVLKSVVAQCGDGTLPECPLIETLFQERAVN